MNLTELVIDKLYLLPDYYDKGSSQEIHLTQEDFPDYDPSDNEQEIQDLKETKENLINLSTDEEKINFIKEINSDRMLSYSRFLEKRDSEIKNYTEQLIEVKSWEIPSELQDFKNSLIRDLDIRKNRAITTMPIQLQLIPENVEEATNYINKLISHAEMQISHLTQEIETLQEYWKNKRENIKNHNKLLRLIAENLDNAVISDEVIKVSTTHNKWED